MADGGAQQDVVCMGQLEELRRRLFFALLGILTAAIVLFIAKDWVFNRLIFAPRNPDFITFRAWCALGHLTGAGDRLCVTEIHYELINTTISALQQLVDSGSSPRSVAGTPISTRRHRQTELPSTIQRLRELELLQKL